MKTFEDYKKLHQEGETQAAILGYEELLKNSPADSDILHFLALAYAELGLFDKAKAYIEKAILAKPDDLNLQMHFANILKAMQNYESAQQILLNIIEQNSNYVAAYNNLGTLYFSQVRYKDAERYFKIAIDKQSNYADAYYNLGLTLTRLNKLENAINVYNALLGLNPTHVGALFHLACLYMKHQEIEKAIQLFLKIEQNYPEHFETQTNLATCYVRLGKLREAQTHYSKALEITPNDTQVLFNLGVLAMQQSDLHTAINYYQKIITQHPDNAEVHNNLAFIYLLQKKNTLALQHFKTVSQLQPSNFAVQHTIAILTKDKNIKQSPPEYIEKLFDSYADHFDSHLLNMLDYKLPKIFFNALKPIIDKDLVILDLGCGTGLSGELFKPYAQQLIGVDLSQNMLAQAYKKNIYDELIHDDILHFLNNKRDVYDLIIATDVIEYFGELDEFFKLITQSLKLGGYFAFNTEINLTENFSLSDSGRFTHRKEYLVELLQQNELSIVSYETVPLRTQAHKAVSGHFFIARKS